MKTSARILVGVLLTSACGFHPAAAQPRQSRDISAAETAEPDTTSAAGSAADAAPTPGTAAETTAPAAPGPTGQESSAASTPPESPHSPPASVLPSSVPPAPTAVMPVPTTAAPPPPPKPMEANFVHARLGLGAMRAGGINFAGPELSAVYRYEYNRFGFEFSPFELMIDGSGDDGAIRWGIFDFNSFFILHPHDAISAYAGGGLGVGVTWTDRLHGDNYGGGGFDARAIGGIDFLRLKRVRVNLQAEVILPIYFLKTGSEALQPDRAYSPMFLFRAGLTRRTRLTIGDVLYRILDAMTPG